MKDIDSSLGTHRNMTTDIHAESVFCDLINRGNLRYPTQELLDQVKKMYEIFCAHNKDYTIQAKLYIPSTINTRMNLALLLLFGGFGCQSSSEIFFNFSKSSYCECFFPI